jgi:UDP-N-acetylglucosamine--N-acetylmuramyl-(pentapeptide) pyrophosphoryl-undecaprenol N-acetylglucosamine transferase
MQRNKPIICFTAGHSGGHILPCLTLANRYDNYLINFITTNKTLDSSILKNKNINKCLKLNLNRIPNTLLLWPLFLIRLSIAFFQSLFFLLLNRPERLITTGGLIAVPPFLAAKILRINLEIYELNVEPGKTTQFLSNICNNIKICFSETQRFFKKKCTLINYPIRFKECEKKLQIKEIKDSLNLDHNKKIILILGGSQGSTFLNMIIEKLINKYQPKKIQIIHQIGINDNLQKWTNFYKNKNIKNITFSYYENIKDFYLISDLILCRSGAGTLAEILFFKKKCITIPLETKTTNHQILNAKAFSKKSPTTIKVIGQNKIHTIIESIHKSLNI